MKVKNLKDSSDWGMPSRTGIGVTISVLYAGLLIAMTIWRWKEIVELPLNSLGDFAAGAFGPMAILWLVLGYFQQGDELKQNTDALRLQAEELANTVQQQRELVALGYEQLKREKRLAQDERNRQVAAARPKFELSIPEAAWEVDGRTILEIDAKNVGAPCSHLRAHAGVGGLSLSVRPLGPDPQIWRITAYGPASEAFEVFDFYISYLDSAGNTGSQVVSVNYYADDDAAGHTVSGEDDIRVWNESVVSRVKSV